MATGIPDYALLRAIAEDVPDMALSVREHLREIADAIEGKHGVHRPGNYSVIRDEFAPQEPKPQKPRLRGYASPALIREHAAAERSAPTASTESPAPAAQPKSKPIGYLPAHELGRLHSGHNANLRSVKFGPSRLDDDVPVYLDAPAAQPVEPDPMNYKGMFLAAVEALAEIDGLLGLPEDGCNDPQNTVSALKDYIAGVGDMARARDEWVDANYAAAAQQSCRHPSWETIPGGKERCLMCGAVGEERRYLKVPAAAQPVEPSASPTEPVASRDSGAVPLSVTFAANYLTAYMQDEPEEARRKLRTLIDAVTHPHPTAGGSGEAT